MRVGRRSFSEELLLSVGRFMGFPAALSIETTAVRRRIFSPEREQVTGAGIAATFRDSVRYRKSNSGLYLEIKRISVSTTGQTVELEGACRISTHP